MDPDAALEWLQKSNRVELTTDLTPKEDGSHWSALYSYFFEFHLKSPNQQREVINEIIDDAQDGLNWAHACLVELVERRYVHTVLTTNFDQLVLQGIIRYAQPGSTSCASFANASFTATLRDRLRRYSSAH